MSMPVIWDSLKKRQIPPPGHIPGPLFNLLGRAAALRGKVSTLSSLERSICAICHQETDRVPVSPILCAGARQISGIHFPDYALNAEQAARVFLDGFEFVGGDAVVLMLDLSVEAADFGQAMEYPDNSTPMPDYRNPLLRDHEDYRRLQAISFKDSRRMNEFVRLCSTMVEKIGWRSIVSGFVFGPLGVLAMLRGAENLFKDCRQHPKEVMAACETITGVLLEFVQAQCRTGLPAIAIDTLFASRSGLPKNLWEEIEGPFAREIANTIKSAGVVTAIHNCGDSPYFDAQIRAMEPAIINFADLPDDCATPRELKQRYGQAVTLMGYLPTPLLVHGTPREVMEECRRHIDELAPGGGFILSPGCEYPPNISLNNAFALIKAAETYGRR